MKYRSSKILDDFEFHDAEFTFESALIEWDAYRKPAWYEERPFH